MSKQIYLGNYCINKSIISSNSSFRFYDQFSDLNNARIYEPEEIARQQLESVRNHLKSHFEKTNGLITLISNDLNGRSQLISNESNIINNALTEIEKHFDDFVKNVNNSSDSKSTRVDKSNLESKYRQWQTQLSDLIQKIEVVYNKMMTENGLLNNNDIEKLKNFLGILTIWTNEINSAMAGSKIWQKNKKNFFTKEIEQKAMISDQGFIASVQGIISNLKGSFLELSGKEWINSLLNIEDVSIDEDKTIAVQMGNILGNIYNVAGNSISNKQLTTDIGLFDLSKIIKEQVKIKVQIDGKDQEIPLQDFLKNIETGVYNKKEVILLDEKYTEYMIGGIQAKSGKNQKIFNTSARTKIALNELHTLEARALFEISRSNNKTNRFIAQHRDYDALFNYSLHTQINYLLGKDNSYILTRNGLEYIPDWIDRNKYYFGISQHYSLGTHNNKYAISIKNLK